MSEVDIAPETLAPLPTIDPLVLLRTGTKKVVWSDSRRFPRLEAKGVVELRPLPTFPALERGAICHQVWMRDMSRGGLRIIHGEQLFPGERCTLKLPNGASLTLEIIWCHRLTSGLYVTGCSFGQVGDE